MRLTLKSSSRSLFCIFFYPRNRSPSFPALCYSSPVTFRPGSTAAQRSSLVLGIPRQQTCGRLPAWCLSWRRVMCCSTRDQGPTSEETRWGGDESGRGCRCSKGEVPNVDELMLHDSISAILRKKCSCHFDCVGKLRPFVESYCSIASPPLISSHLISSHLISSLCCVSQDHLALMMELLGRMPKKVRRANCSKLLN